MTNLDTLEELPDEEKTVTMTPSTWYMIEEKLEQNEKELRAARVLYEAVKGMDRQGATGRDWLGLGTLENAVNLAWRYQRDAAIAAYEEALK
jgi:hypothetical protein